MENEPSLLIVSERRKRGGQPIYGERLSRRIEVWVTEEQFKDIKSIAQMEGKKSACMVRDAIDCYAGDFRERLVFKRPKPYIPE